MDGMIGTLELIASSDWCSVLPAVLCDLDLDGSIRTLSPLISPNFTTEYVFITSASKELNPISKLFSEKISKEIKIISSKMNNDLAT
jgi:DNA-binding transcriptional LysR family regulator